ncbi:MAG: LacI family DNA-binding transcriptional regulator [Turicibacter sp.]
MSNIKDVAKLSGVSISTVSCALNGTGRISEETRQKIIEAAKQLNYTPNGYARSLKSKQMNIIGVFSDFSGPVHTEIIKGVQDTAKKNNYEVIFGECLVEKSVVTRLLSERIVDAAIIISSSINSDTLVDLSTNKFPIVLVDRKEEGEHISHITINDKEAGYNVVKHFHTLGYKDIGFISGPKDSHDSEQRFEGFKLGVKEFKMNFKKAWYTYGDFCEFKAYDAMIELIEKKDLPRALFVANDQMAAGVMLALRKYNIKVPEEIALVGFDDISWGRHLTPALTTVRRPAYDLGIIAAHTLFNNLKGKQSTKNIVLSTELVIRESCGAMSVE